MSPMAAPEKTVIVYYDDSTGEIYTDRDGHFHFTDLSGGHFPESQHGHGRHHGHHHHRQHQEAGIQPTSSHAAGQRRGAHNIGDPGVKAEVPGEGLLNTLLAAGINVPIETYRAHQEEVRRQQLLQQRAERQVVHPQARTMVGGRNSPFLVRHLSKDNVDGYISAMKQAWEKQRLLQAEKQAERELQNQIGGHGRGSRAREDDKKKPSSISSAPGRIGGAILNAGRDGALPCDDVLDILRASCAESDADYRSPGEVKSVGRSCDALVASNQGQKLLAADSDSQRPQRNTIGRRARDERSASPSRAAAVHSATLVQTPQGLVIHFRPDGESESDVKNGAGRPNHSFAVEDEEAEENEKEQEEKKDQEDYNNQRSQRLLARVGELSRIRAFVEDEEARLAAGLRERDAEVYRRQRCAELRARIRWAVDEQNRLTLEAEEFMPAADEKYDRVSRLGELVTSVERRLESLTAGLGEQDEITGTSAVSVGRLLRDPRRARDPDMELTDDEKDVLRCFAQYGPRESDNLTRPSWSENEPFTSKRNSSWSGGAPEVRRGTSPSAERRSVRGSGAEQPRGWTPSPALSTFRSPRSSGFQRQSQFDGNWDVNAVSRRKQGYEGVDDEEVGLRGLFHQTRHQQGQRPCRLSRPYRINEDLINRECSASGQIGGPATQADVRGLLNMVNNISGGQASPFLSQGPDNERFAIMSRPSLRRSGSSKSSNGEILSMTSGRGVATPSPRSVPVVTGASRTTSHALRPASPSEESQHLRQLDFIQDAVRDVSTGRGYDQRAKRDDENRRQGSLEVPTPQRSIPISFLSARAASSASGNTDSQRREAARPPSRSSAMSGNSGLAAAAAAAAATDAKKSDRIRSPRLLTPETRRPWFESEEGDGGMTVAITHAQHDEVKKSQERQKNEQEAAATKIERFLRNRLDTSTDRQTLHNLRILAQKEREIRALKDGAADERQQQKPQHQERLQRQQDQCPHERQTHYLTPSNLSQLRDDPVSRARAFAEPVTVVLNSVEGKELTSFDRDSALPPGAHVHPRHRNFLAYEAELDRLLTELDSIQNAGGSDEVRELRKHLVTEVNGMLAEVDTKKREAYAATAARDWKGEEGKEGGGSGIEGPERTEKVALDEQAKREEERATADGSWDKLSELYRGENNEGERPYAEVKHGEGEKKRAEGE